MTIKIGAFEDSDGRRCERDFIECDFCLDYADQLDITKVDLDGPHYCSKCTLMRCPKCRAVTPDFPDLCDMCALTEDMESGWREFQDAQGFVSVVRS